MGVIRKTPYKHGYEILFELQLFPVYPRNHYANE